MGGSDRTDDEQRWRPRPLLSFALRLVSVLVPAAAGAASAYGYVVAMPAPGGLATIPWAFGLVLSSTIATAFAERIGKRFLPLAVLLRLSLVFPDRAPSRFAMARGAGNVRVLERRIRDAREQGVDQAPVRAAEQILSLVAALSAHDRKTRGHSERVRAFTDLVAGQLRLPEADRDRLRWAALLHDIGKLHVPAKILNKPGRPEPREWETLQGHPAAGARIAAPLMAWLGPWGDAIEQHHERFGGGGYPALARGGGDLARREDRERGRLVRGDDRGAVLQEADERAGRPPRARGVRRRAVRPGDRPRIPERVPREAVVDGRTDVVDRPAPGARPPAASGWSDRGGRQGRDRRDRRRCGGRPADGSTAPPRPRPRGRGERRRMRRSHRARNPSAHDDVRSGGVRPTAGAGDHLDVPKGTGGGSGEDHSGGGTGGGGSDPRWAASGRRNRRRRPGRHGGRRVVDA